ncbi:transglycosylase SLT domain-containing protein [Acidithiobacillus ferrivorans]|uniref:Transglycosylase SLT domain-containing protein n=2 Tax=Acidithiobacillus ferrivorans TaxID=160808 RepID=A0A7T4WC79_9PROT|nr:transglycosylase SLT domain-containing protein [Acidithiobacillus ferrivorans]
MAAIVRVESGGDPLAMWDNTARRGYHPHALRQALAILRRLMAAGHQVDVGIAQVDTENFREYGLTPTTALNACANLHAGAEILQAAWNTARREYPGNPQRALFHAFEIYNSGAPIGDRGYANHILAAAVIPVYIQGDGAMRYHAVSAAAFALPVQTIWDPAAQKPGDGFMQWTVAHPSSTVNLATP